ncbi:hypothetical protein [Polyangium sp. 15x6]|uniref:hypothetical protein n=1 Tax=Polyangium sp. 15x6 TaxID=3042687 RepID=UPI00249CBEED|nr:hypothetical protein [Polyangium sp. 15x6]MDI3290500.1 hypothetical protein [Polyangium sp. 15x6]
MKRRLAIVLLTLGTIGGYAAGFASLRCHSGQRRQHFEHHVAKICVDAARHAEAPPPPPPPR